MQPSPLKPSFYNHLIPFTNGQHILFNAYTLATCIIEPHLLEEIIKLLSGSVIEDQTPLVEVLSQSKFLISNTENEKAIIRENYAEAKKKKEVLDLTIAPTLGCNFNCAYCFESELARANFSQMSPHIQQQLVTFAKNHIMKHNSKFLSVTWFGGEPLLAIKVIQNLSQQFLAIAKEFNIDYNANIITNGYKLTPDNIDTLLMGNVLNAQITIDGHEHIHDKRRYLKNGQGSYQKIITNITNALNKGLDINVRINIDKKNFDDIGILLTDFKKRDILNKVSLSLGYIAEEYSDLENTIENLSGGSFADLDLKLKSTVNQKATPQEWMPERVTNFCAADNEGSYMIGPLGEFYQCWEDFGDKMKIVGNISSNIIVNSTYVAEYMEFDPTLHPKCSQCNVMPLCMGGCPKQRLAHDGIPQCGVFKYNLNDWIINYANNKVEEVKK